jgi:hypothetical protein
MVKTLQETQKALRRLNLTKGLKRAWASRVDLIADQEHQRREFREPRSLATRLPKNTRVQV